MRYSTSGSNITLRNYFDTVATLVDLSPFTNYSIGVTAVNVNGTGPFSTPVYLRTDRDSKWMYTHMYLQFSLLIWLLKSHLHALTMHVGSQKVIL